MSFVDTLDLQLYLVINGLYQTKVKSLTLTSVSSQLGKSIYQKYSQLSYTSDLLSLMINL